MLGEWEIGRGELEHDEGLVPKLGGHLLNEFVPDSKVGDVEFNFELIKG